MMFDCSRMQKKGEGNIGKKGEGNVGKMYYRIQIMINIFIQLSRTIYKHLLKIVKKSKSSCVLIKLSIFKD